MKTKILTLLIVPTFFFACNQSVEKEEIVEDETEHKHADHSDKINLNEGKKWKVDPEMLEIIQKMKSDIVTFSSGKESELKDYQELSDKIQTNIEELTSSCTMTGQAHDELHKWLLPFIELAGEFEECSEMHAAKEIHLALKESFVEFEVYFE